ncbi:MAG: hypothetical protein ACXWHZ_19735 [Usitatibacter sp.]
MRALFALAAMAARLALAADPEDEAALRLADETVTKVERRGDWRLAVEAARAQTTQGGGIPDAWVDRLSFDATYDSTLAPGWRAVFSDRIDARWRDAAARQENVNTLREAYVSWQPRPDALADAGRINLRYGVAYGYNPTDFFRAGAVRSVVSIDPASARENRLGSVMARAQALWTQGAVTALFSPRLARQPTDDGWSADFGATNHRERWQLAASQRIAEDLAPQWIVHGEAGRSPQAGLNLSMLVNDATVAYVEASAGRSQSLVAQALMRPEDEAFRARLSFGATYTLPSKLTLTLEYEHNGAAPDAAQWDALRRGSPLDYGRYRAFVSDQQETATRGRVFFRAAWQDALVNHFDLTSNDFHNPIDGSRQYGIEARYHWKHVDAAVQWQLRTGAQRTEFGGIGTLHSWQALVTWFL